MPPEANRIASANVGRSARDFVFLAVWPLAVTACLALDILWQSRQFPPTYRSILTIGAGGALAASVAAAIVMPRLGHKLCQAPQRMAAYMLLLGGFGFAVSAGLFAIDHLSRSTEWQDPEFTGIWLAQLIFTFAGALYQFLVSGLRLYLPLGPVALLVFSAALARPWRG